MSCLANADIAGILSYTIGTPRVWYSFVLPAKITGLALLLQPSVILF